MSVSKGSRKFLFSLPLMDKESGKGNSLSVEENKEMLFQILQDKLSFEKVGTLMTKINLPDFKIGTLDTLVNAGEDLAKFCPQFEGVLERLAGHVRALFSNDETQIASSFVVDESKHPFVCFHASSSRGLAVNPTQYVDNFTWNSLKYRTDLSVKEIAEYLTSEVNQVDTLIKARMNAYYHERAQIDSVLRSKRGNLLVKDLSEVLNKDEVVCESEFLETLLVVVPKATREEWEGSYETLVEYVVPRSAKLVASDDEYALFSVVVFKKAKSDFIANASSRKFVVRPLPSFEASSDDAKMLEQSEKNLQAQWATLVRLVQTNFGEAFAAYCHLIMLRLFVESVLHYGLPVNYLFVFAKINSEKHGRKFNKSFLTLLETLRLPGISLMDLSAALHKAHGDGSSAGVGPSDELELWNALNVANKSFEPYVSIPLKTSFL